MIRATDSVDVIEGTVSGLSAARLRDAIIILTAAGDRASFTSSTDDSGRFVFRVRPPRRDYLVHVSATGYKAQRVRVTFAEDEYSRRLAISLSPQALAISGVHVVAPKTPIPPRGAATSTEPGASEWLDEGVAALIPPDEASSVAAHASSAPGIIREASGISALGLPASQSATTLNGLSFAGTELPRLAQVKARISTSTFDPARGGFSAAQVALELAPGSVYSHRSVGGSASAPQSQLAGPYAREVGDAAMVLWGGVAADGAFASDKVLYSGALDVFQRRAPVTTAAASPQVLTATRGLSLADMAALTGALRDAKALYDQRSTIPTGDDAVTTLVRVDHPLGPTSSLGLLGYGRFDRQSGQDYDPTVVAGHGRSQDADMGSVQLVYSNIVRERVLHELRAAVSTNGRRSRPDERAPAAIVSVLPSDASLETGAVNFSFGGSGAEALARRTWSFEAQDEMQWFAGGKTHRWKTHVETQLQQGDARGASNTLGTYTYNSIDALAANQPSSFSRTLGSPIRSASVWHGAVALGDYWTITPTFQLLYGGRFDADRMLSGASFNSEAFQTLGRRTDVLASSVGLSPRIGFSWFFGGRDEPSVPLISSSLGHFHSAPSGVLRGGIGAFRNTWHADDLLNALGVDGNVGAIRTIQCIGASVPPVDWSLLTQAADLPTNCQGSLVSAPVRLGTFAPSYAPSTSWRANLGWLGGARRWQWSVEGTLSLNTEQPSGFNANLRAGPLFVLPTEANRPVFVDTGDMIATTGLTSAAAARRVSTLGDVIVLTSNGRSISRQLTATVRSVPALLGRTTWRLAYTYGRLDVREREGDAFAFADPRYVEWAPGLRDIRHQVLAQAGRVFGNGVSATVAARLQSGSPFTPVVQGDVNGDGVGGDRAFVFAPSMMSDASSQQAMNGLLRDAPSWARECLVRQLGRPAGLNSCRGPWTLASNAQLSVGGSTLHLGERVNIGINVTNPVAAIDYIAHGKSKLHHWGSPGLPDPTLYVVRGFDPLKQSFRYVVNPGFGNDRAFSGWLDVPLRLTLDVNIDLGAPLPVQTLKRSLTRGRGGAESGTRLTATEIKARYSRTVPNIYSLVMGEADSLLLNREQYEQLTRASKNYQAAADSLWTPLATYLANLPDAYDGAEALRRAEETTDRVWDLVRAQGSVIRGALSPVQQGMLPQIVLFIINSKEKVKFRFSFSG